MSAEWTERTLGILGPEYTSRIVFGKEKCWRELTSQRCGVYCFSASDAYSSSGKFRGRKAMLICDVAKGNVFDTRNRIYSLQSAPEGFDSVHAVPICSDETSEFEVLSYTTLRSTVQNSLIRR